MKLGELITSLAPVAVNLPPDTEIEGLQLDSRLVRPGDAFIAIVGARADGHDFIESALLKGARCVFSERPLADTVPHLVLRDTQIALAPLGSRFYGHPARRMRMVGVTGTNGKTSVTQIVKEVLERLTAKRVGLIGTNRNLIGELEMPAVRTTPDALSLQGLLYDMAESGCRYCVMEVSSHALVQGRVDEIYYDVAVFTNLTQDHLDYHGTMKRYFEAKKVLFDQCRASVINIDDVYGWSIENAPNRLSYAVKDESADLLARDIQLMTDHVVFTASYRGRSETIVWSAPGEFSVYNALAAVGACIALGLDFSQVAQAVSEVAPVKGRMERVPFREGVTALIDYAHTPDALQNVLETARGFASRRVMVVVGCGGDRDPTKRPIMGDLATRYSDFAFLTTDNPRTEDPAEILRDMEKGVSLENYVVIPDRSEAIRAALTEAEPGDVVLLCGKGHETYQEINGIHHHYDEREVIAALRRELRD
jgi:UDP-N-acetylmuramoyl-L-alanyl-D-glutamate--2,6-diaminopimelate ligase